MKKIDWLKNGKYILLVSGVIVGLLLTTSGLLAIFVGNENMGLVTAMQIIRVTTIISVVIGCLIVTGKTKRASLLNSMITAVVIICFLMMLKFLMFPGETIKMGMGLYIVVGAVVVGLISGKKRERR